MCAPGFFLYDPLGGSTDGPLFAFSFLDAIGPFDPEQDIKDLMRKAGEVTFADLSKERDDEGVVEFSSEKDVQMALKNLDGENLRGKPISLRLFDPARDSIPRDMGRGRDRDRDRGEFGRERRERDRYDGREERERRERDRRGRSRSRSRDRKRSHSRESRRSRSRDRTGRSDRDRERDRGGRSDRDRERDRGGRRPSRSPVRSKSPVRRRSRSMSRD
ncbi:Serine/arginine-rich splicing factor 6 [Gamsiella multidivaricata]|nr:Serine/arginine-rich splicing factor 6 [Gamsiella multidivaricata]